MRCIYCNTPLSGIDYCTGCGADITLLKRCARISNLLYNEGLEKARVRDIEGAITTLRRSLKMNKENIDARNLLGLCYMETGEVVAALCEWVVSKNRKPNDNLAEYYINQLQSNKNRLDIINQTIRKYNQSVTYCRDDNEDMAIIQLKKVISQNPKLIKAYQLLALLYMKRQDYEKARKLLKRVARIDTANTMTLRYLQEIEELTGKATNLDRKHKHEEKTRPEGVNGTLRYMSGTEMLIQPTTFRDSSTVATLINIVLGMLLGGAVVWFLIVPASRQNVNDEANQAVTDANTQMAATAARVDDLESQIDDYLQQTQEAEEEKEEAVKRAESYEELLSISNIYIQGDQSTAAEQIAALDADLLEGDARELYDTLLAGVQSSIFTQAYNEGTSAYVQGDYSTAATCLQKAVDADPAREMQEHEEALWYLAYAWYNMGDQNKASTYFADIIQYFPGTEYANLASSYISSGNVEEEAAADGVSAEELDDLSGLSVDTPVQEEADQEVYWDESDVAWTDPTTGLKYDGEGNLLSGQ